VPTRVASRSRGSRPGSEGRPGPCCGAVLGPSSKRAVETRAEHRSTRRHPTLGQRVLPLCRTRVTSPSISVSNVSLLRWAWRHTTSSCSRFNLDSEIRGGSQNDNRPAVGRPKDLYVKCCCDQRNRRSQHILPTGSKRPGDPPHHLGLLKEGFVVTKENEVAAASDMVAVIDSVCTLSHTVQGSLDNHIIIIIIARPSGSEIASR